MNIILNWKGMALAFVISSVVYMKGFLDGVKDEQSRMEKENEEHN